MLAPSVLHSIEALLGPDDAEHVRRYPAHPSAWQPVHTVYVPADRFTETTVADWGREALAALDRFGPPVGVDKELAALVRRKLADAPIDDLRVDFEDGYGTPGDDVEDDHAVRTGAILAHLDGVPSLGIRMKSLESATRMRGIRTLDMVLNTMLHASPSFPAGFRPTLPKVTSVPQVQAMVLLCEELESAYGLAGLRFEIQIETPQAILGADGTATVAKMIQAAQGRCAGLHYGTYDYSASLGIAGPYQSMDHPVADHAKAVMLVAAADTGIPVSDGSTNILPVGDRAAVQAAWATHLRLVTRSLRNGYYQGWDLHPAQLVTRHAATFAFYRAGWPDAAARLRVYLERAAGGMLDEPATARALTDFLFRALRCEVVSQEEIESAVGADAAVISALAR